MRFFNFYNSFAAVLLLGLAISGCRHSSETASIHGSVSYRGTPVSKASITFFPTSGRSVGAAVTDGQYTAELAPGEYTATIDIAPELPDGFREGDPIPKPKVVLPEQYTSRAKSTLKAIVSADQEQPIDFRLP